MRLQSQNALGQAGLLIGRDHLTRIDMPPTRGNPIGLDDYERARDELPTVASDLAERFASNVGERFFGQSATPYAAFQGPRAAVSAHRN